MKRLLKSSYAILTVFLIFGFFGSCYGQKWIYRDSTVSYTDVIQTSDGNYVACAYGSTKNLIKLDPYGNIIWNKDNAGLATGIVEAPFRGFAVSTILGLSGFGSILLNYNGVPSWVKAYPHIVGPGRSGYADDILYTSIDGGFLINGSKGAQLEPCYLVKTNSSGDTLWTYTNLNRGSVTGVMHAYDETYIAVGQIYTANNTFQFYIMKIDANGSLIWEKTNSQTGQPAINVNSVIETANNNILICGYGLNNIASAFLFETNSSGDSIWSKTYPSNLSFNDLITTTDGGYAVVSTVDSVSIGLTKFDANLDSVWKRVYPFKGNANALKQTSDGGYIIAGEGVIIKTDADGFTNQNVIQGNVFIDLNSNCAKDSSEFDALNQLVMAQGNKSFYDITDYSGQYSIWVDSGMYNISLPLSNYWDIDSCALSNLSVHLPILSDTITLDIPITPKILCPHLFIEVGTRGITCSSSSNFQISYCNNGTITAPNAYTEITFDPNLIINSSSIPWNTPQTGNNYRFDLGNIAVGQCGNFTVNVSVDCNNTQIGQTLCTEAHIYPDSICLPPDSSWDGSSIKVTGECDADSVHLEIRNEGQDMQWPLDYYIVEDNVMFRNGPFQLLSSGVKGFTLPAIGSTWTLLAGQSAGHPGDSHPLISIEGCGTNSQGGFSKGYVMDFPPDEQDDFVAIDCHEVVASFDPNTKAVSPQGLNFMGYIVKDQPLEYQVNFQNTGTDTAFTIVVRDTLSDKLDITSLHLGVSDHAYTFAIHNSNILEWTFSNILLPDSSTNEPASHGFLTFSIDQDTTNQPGDVIFNQADIYFDYNAPVVTNTTINTIADDYKQWLAVEELSDNDNSILIYPNPTEGQLTIVLTGKPQQEHLMNIYDLTGRVVKTYTFKDGQYTITGLKLQQGMYLYEVIFNSQQMGQGKLIIY